MLQSLVRVMAMASLLALLQATAYSETIEEKAQVCAACHGESGVPPEQAFPVPVIWGQISATCSFSSATSNRARARTT